MAGFLKKIVNKITDHEGVVLGPWESDDVETEKEPRVPIEFPGGQVTKTRGGWRTKCDRCGAKLEFGIQDIKTFGPPNKPSVYDEVCNGMIWLKEHNRLAEDVEKKRIDWVEYLRGQRRLMYMAGRGASFSGSTSLKLTCERCGANTSVSVSIGGDVKLKELPKNVQALITLGIHKEDSVKLFQLRAGKLAEQFVEAVRLSQDEIKQLEQNLEQIKNLIADLKAKTPSLIVNEFLHDIVSAAESSKTVKTRELEEWQRSQIREAQKTIFPEIKGGEN